jgi:hypothetical protein
MAMTSFKKAKTMEHAAGLMLFTMPEHMGMSEQACTYLAMRETKDYARHAWKNIVVVEWALCNMVPPPPLNPSASQPTATSPEASVARATV